MAPRCILPDVQPSDPSLDVDGGKSSALAHAAPPHCMTTAVCSLRHAGTRHSGAIFDPRVSLHGHFDAASLELLAAKSVEM